MGEIEIFGEYILEDNAMENIYCLIFEEISWNRREYDQSL